MLEDVGLGYVGLGAFAAATAVVMTVWIMIKYGDKKREVPLFIITSLLFVMSHYSVGIGMYERSAVRPERELVPDVLYQTVGKVDYWTDGEEIVHYAHLKWAVGRRRALFQLKKEPPAKFVVDDRNGNFVAVE